MSDPFAEFKQGQPPVEGEVPPAAKQKKPHKKKAASNGKAQEAKPAKVPNLAPPKKSRKPRQAKELRLPISTLLEIGSLSDEESGALLSIGAGLQKLPKKSRQKISAALSKIFS
jgi:hypothetical protein